MSQALITLVACAAVLVTGADECEGGVCPVPDNFPAAPNAPDFDVLEVTESGQAKESTLDDDYDDAENDPLLQPSPESAAGKAAAAATAAAAAGGADSDAAAQPTIADQAKKEDEKAEKAEEMAQPASKLGASKVLSSAKVAAAAADGSEATAKPATTAAAQVEDEAEEPFDLDTELGLMKVTAQMGSVGTMMDILTNVTFKLGDTDRDDHISKPEARAFADSHLAPEGCKLGVALGLHGGHVDIASDAALDSGVEAVFGACDTAPADGRVSRSEAKACKLLVHDMIVEVNRKRLEAALKERERRGAAAGGDGGAAGGGGGGGGGANDRQQEALRRWMEQQQATKASSGSSGGGGSREASVGGGGGRPAPSANPIQAELVRQLKAVERVLLRNYRNPTLNTLVGAVGVASLLLREALSFNLLNIREALRGMVGSNVDEFNGRLLTLSLIACVLAKFTDLGSLG